MAKLPPHIRAVSLDFANTLYPLRAGELEVTIERLHSFLEAALGKSLKYGFLREVYLDVRARQFTENRPTLRENDFTERIESVVSAALGGVKPPTDLVTAAEHAYAEGFIETMVAPPGLRDTVAALSERFEGRIAVCSNFIRADAIRAPLTRDGIMPLLKGAVVSCEVGFIKPHAAVFQSLVSVLDVAPHEIVHVGDDWDADVLGAIRYGMSTIYTSQWRNEVDPCYGLEASVIADIASLGELLDM